MAFDETAAVAYLRTYYNEPVAKRAIWKWAGGPVQAVDYEADGWQRMWALTGDTAPPHPMALLREALFDLPGSAELIVMLADAAKTRFPEGIQAAPVLAGLVESLGPGFDPDLLHVALYAFPSGSRHDVFAAVVESFQGRIAHIDEDTEQPRIEAETQGEAGTESERPARNADPVEQVALPGRLEQRLHELAGSAETPVAALWVRGIDYLLEKLPEMTDTADNPPYREASGVLSKMLGEAFASTDAAQRRNAIRALPLKPLADLADASADPIFMAGIAGVGRQIDTLLRSVDEQPIPAAAETAMGCLHALWATERPEA